MRPTNPIGLTMALLASSSVASPAPSIAQVTAPRSARQPSTRTRSPHTRNGSGNNQAKPCSLVERAIAAAMPSTAALGQRPLSAVQIAAYSASTSQKQYEMSRFVVWA
ncbi:MAG: hypothetical protein U0802_20665 [Candidatus Binatia bacterium]